MLAILLQPTSASRIVGKMAIDPKDLQLLFQGASDQEYQCGDYGQIPCRQGILKLKKFPADDSDCFLLKRCVEISAQ